MKTIYYEDIDSITVKMCNLMEEEFKKLGITLTDADTDKLFDFMDNDFRDKYSCMDYRNHN